MGKYRGGFAWSSNMTEGDPYLVFNLHPVMMILGFFVFPTQAILVFRMMPMEHYKAKVYHFVCHLLSMICIAIGVTAAIVYHYRLEYDTSVSQDYPHMVSLHSWFGIATLGCFAFQFLTGFLGYCWPKLNFDARKSTLPFHQFLGMITFIMACMTSSLGIMNKVMDLQTVQKIARMGPEVQLANWMGLAIGLLMAFMIYVIMSQVNKKRERGSAEEVESLRREKSSYDHDY